MADHNGGLRIIDLGNGSPTEIGFWSLAGYAYGVTVQGDYAYLANSAYGFDIVDVSDPTRPAYVASLIFSGGKDVVIDGAEAFVSCYSTSNLQIIDLLPP